MNKMTLTAAPRTTLGKKNAGLRADGKVPAVAYGRAKESVSIEVDARELDKVFEQAGYNQIVDVKIGDEKPQGALIHDVQRNGRTGTIIHADLYLVRMDETLRTEIPLHFIGESTAVYQDEGTLVKNVEEIEVECLPGNLVENITVDISVLDDFEKTITLADLVIPAGIKLLEEDLETLVAKVDPPRSEDEMAELDEAVTAELPEGVAEEVVPEDAKAE